MIGVDAVIEQWIVGHRSGVLTPLMTGISSFGRGGLGWIAVAFVLMLVRRLPVRAMATLLLAVLCAAFVVNWVVKPAVGRTRPFERTPALEVIGPRPDDPSFPSGHAGNAGAAAFVLSVWLPEWRAAWWLLAVVIAYSRVYLGDHYPLDVICGSVVGAAIAWCVVRATHGRLGPERLRDQT